MEPMNKQQSNFQLQSWILVVGLLLFMVKALAYYLTSSVAILTDALESIVNIIAGFIGLYSLWLSARPRDRNHPYGHGKAEFLSASAEGLMIILAGGFIWYEAIYHLIFPRTIQSIDKGMWLVAGTAAIHFFMGRLAIRKGKTNGSPALEATGKHLQSDSYSTLGLVIGLALVWIFKKNWIDSAVALIFGGWIMLQGIQIVRTSLAGIMDEADNQLLENLIEALNQQRNPDWVDIHNLRIIKYGSILHLDCHLTVPWYYNVHEAHRVVDALQEMVNKYFGQKIELFVHTDGCLPLSCGICSMGECSHRKMEMQERIIWSIENITENEKHFTNSR